MFWLIPLPAGAWWRGSRDKLRDQDSSHPPITPQPSFVCERDKRERDSLHLTVHNYSYSNTSSWRKRLHFVKFTWNTEVERSTLFFTEKFQCKAFTFQFHYHSSCCITLLRSCRWINIFLLCNSPNFAFFFFFLDNFCYYLAVRGKVHVHSGQIDCKHLWDRAVIG